MTSHDQFIISQIEGSGVEGSGLEDKPKKTTPKKGEKKGNKRGTYSSLTDTVSADDRIE